MISSKLGGVLLMFGAIVVLLVLPWLDRSPVRSAMFRPLYSKLFWVFLVDCLVLGYIGGQPAEEPYITVGQIATLYYFLHFLVIIPLLPRFEKTLPLPNSISEAVLKKS